MAEAVGEKPGQNKRGCSMKDDFPVSLFIGNKDGYFLHGTAPFLSV
ncbi:MAG: hypothetical protein NC300_05965 [Bacteroidales bacterium]|nr:hypothetical protein [Clostridium sp.]MCM1203669.1 hypothetical protein [Bacteroidales bacterium]